MSEPGAEQKRALDEFRRTYADRLPARVLAIEADWNMACIRDWSMERLDALCFNVHNLHGSAATCGFRVVSERAGLLEVIVRAVRERAIPPTAEQRAEFASRMDGLKRALQDAGLT